MWGERRKVTKEAEEVEAKSEVRRRYTQVELEQRFSWFRSFSLSPSPSLGGQRMAVPASAAGAGGPALRSQPQWGSSGVRPLLPKGQDFANLLREKTRNPRFPLTDNGQHERYHPVYGDLDFFFFPQHKYCKLILILIIKPRQRGNRGCTH